MIIHATFYFSITNCILRSPSSFMFCYVTPVASTDFKDQDYVIPVTLIKNVIGIPQTVLSLILDLLSRLWYPSSLDHGEKLSILPPNQPRIRITLN